MLTQEQLGALAEAATNRDCVAGLTHNFYRYPARFSPAFARRAIDLFSRPCDVVLDPYMGGGTTIVEAIASGRKAVGIDLNPLAVFVAKVKTTPLQGCEKKSLAKWALELVPSFKYSLTGCRPDALLRDPRTRNLNLSKGRFVKKVLGMALGSLGDLQTQNAENFARCAILKTGQWALDGRRCHPSLAEFRKRLQQNVMEMLSHMEDFEKAITLSVNQNRQRVLLELDASFLHGSWVFSTRRPKADLVVTSPPYPGVHVLYHRWQVDGRKESPAPYWITGCEDGHGGSYYTFGSRKQRGLESYFESSLRSLASIRKVMRRGGYVVQMLAFADPDVQLPRYLANMKAAGFREVLGYTHLCRAADNRIWRTVPNRKWHASLKGDTRGSREVVLIHVAH